MTGRLRLLHLEDNPLDAELVQAILEDNGILCETVQVNSKDSFERALDESQFDLVLSDFSLPGYDGLAALQLVRKNHPNLPFILVSGTVGEDGAIDSLRSGATDYILKTRMMRLPSAVTRAMELSESLAQRRKAEELLGKIMENLDDMVAVVDLDGKRVFCSASYEKFFRDIPALIGADAFSEVVEEDRARIRSFFQSIALTGTALRAEYRIRLANGSVRDIETQGSAMRNTDGEINNVILVSRDITSRKRADEQIREQAELLDKARDAICVNDLSQKILFWNKSAERLYGWGAEDALGKNINDLLFPGDSSETVNALRDLMRHGEWQGELHQVDRSGRELIVESRWTLLRDDHGHAKSILLINTDITEKKQTEARLLRTQRMESIGSLAGGIAHDLNNTLAPILMAAELLQTELISESARKKLATIRSSAQRGGEMVRQILSFARGVEGKQEILRVPLLIHEMENFIRTTFPASIRLGTKVASDLPPLRGDPTQLHQVLLNLCVNARDAMPEGGDLVIEASLSRDSGGESQAGGAPHVILTVSDSGQGIPKEAQSRIFEPFFTTKERGKGTGLGLSTVMNIVKAHGGSVQVASEVGKGTTFHIYLPASSVPMSEAPEPAPAPAFSSKGDLVFIVDDDVGILEMTRLNLEARDFQTLTASDATQAVALYEHRQKDIKIVLMDMRMPTASGHETIMKLRAINPEVRVIGISGHEADDEAVQAARPYLKAFLTKPFSIDALLEKIREAMVS